MYLRFCLVPAVAFLVAVGASINCDARPVQNDELHKLDGSWLFVEDRTEGRSVEQGGAPMSVRFTLRVEADAVIYPRSRGDERITLDGSVIEKEDGNGYVSRYRGEWKEAAGCLEYTLEKVRLADDERVLQIKRVFCPTDEGLLVSVISDTGSTQLALYRHPEEIVLPEPAKASITDVSWLADVWTRTRGAATVEERWTPPDGGAMLGLSRTVKGERMTAFEFLRIVERDGGLVYVAQPGGRAPTEFVLTELEKQRAVFVNPRHDYPQRIVYELSPEGTLGASIGFAKGRLQSFEFTQQAQ